MRPTPPSEQAYRAHLLDEQNRLGALLEELRAAATSRGDYEPHDITDDEAAVQADAIEARLADIESALARIDSGAYGLCAVCGVAITETRLQALPATTVCRDCAGRQPDRRSVRT